MAVDQIVRVDLHATGGKLLPLDHALRHVEVFPGLKSGNDLIAGPASERGLRLGGGPGEGRLVVRLGPYPRDVAELRRLLHVARRQPPRLNLILVE